MPVYVAMLRGINVGGHKKIEMDKLRESFEALGCTQVQTFIQSGNVVFKASKVSPVALSEKIEKRIRAVFGFAVPVICRTQDEMDEIIHGNPFLKRAGIDPTKLHVAFLSEAPAPPAVKQFEGLIRPPDEARCVGKEIYFYLPNGVAQSSWMKTPWERTISVVPTTRKWKTVNRVHQMCVACE